MGTRHQILPFQELSSNFLISLDPKSPVHLLSTDNNLVSFHLW